MQLSDIVRSYQDLLPEPARRAEIIRLLPPDYRPVTMAVDLDEVLDGSDPLSLQPFDTVRIYGRYEQDPPKVKIDGEVMRPGEYPLSERMTAVGLVEAAGGFKRSAYRDEAELASYVIKNGKKVLVEQKTITIGKAVDGDKAADVALAPNDELSIRRLSGWNDIGAAVTLNGEVMYPGTYSIHDGERLSSVLRRAGGFRPDAYALGARIERVEVRQMAERNRTELIRRIETAVATSKVSGKAEEQMATLQAMQQQQQLVLTDLRNQPASGRVVLSITNDISKWEGTPADIELRASDSLVVPRRPTYVLVNGQVYNPAAITYSPGKDAAWYLRQAGGPTEFARKKSIFIIRANGSVVGQSVGGWFARNILAVRMQPGDSIIVPERIISGSSAWKELLGTAQFMSSVALTAAAIGHL
jgi:protein involved in polysaccharide export with SLBB domain